MTAAEGMRQALGRFAWQLGRRARVWRATVVRSVGLVGWRRSAGPRTEPGRAVGAGRSSSATVPVVICVWSRPHRLRTTLSCLAAQSHEALTFCIWNNNPAAREQVDAAIAEFAGFPVTVVHSSRNVGGFGRFYFARRIAAEYPWVVFLDDDQITGREWLAALVSEFRPSTIHAARAFHFRGTERFFDRVEASPGERVKYCGTGGMVCDTRVFLEPGLFLCPRRFWFVEDLWLSYIADDRLGWSLYKSATDTIPPHSGRALGATDVLGEPDAFDQSEVLKPTKDRLFRYLVRGGWTPTQTG